MRFRPLFAASALLFATACAPPWIDDTTRATISRVSERWLVLHDDARARDIPLRLYLPPESADPAPLVLFSHGFGESAISYEYLGRYWAARGYVVSDWSAASERTERTSFRSDAHSGFP